MAGQGDGKNLVGWAGSGRGGQWRALCMAARDKKMPQGSALGPASFNSFSSDLQVLMECTVIKAARDLNLKFGKTVNMMKGSTTIQRDPGRMEEGPNWNLKK